VPTVDPEAAPRVVVAQPVAALAAVALAAVALAAVEWEAARAAELRMQG
jgi:hypothetical protein